MAAWKAGMEGNSKTAGKHRAEPSSAKSEDQKSAWGWVIGTAQSSGPQCWTEQTRRKGAAQTLNVPLAFLLI
eukprot:1157948-Pleurochrysis_carterae.AAC.1